PPPNRTHDAAKTTHNLRDDSVKNSDNGVAWNQEVLRNLTDIDDQVNKVREVMVEIAASSDQQSQGIVQINTAVDQMNQVTQQNAANSEESAAAADELSSQANGLWSTVATYTLSARASSERLGGRERSSAAQQAVHALAAPAVGRRARPPANGRSGGLDARQAIPFDEDADEEILQSF